MQVFEEVVKELDSSQLNTIFRTKFLGVRLETTTSQGKDSVAIEVRFEGKTHKSFVPKKNRMGVHTAASLRTNVIRSAAMMVLKIKGDR